MMDENSAGCAIEAETTRTKWCWPETRAAWARLKVAVAKYLAARKARP